MLNFSALRHYRRSLNTMEMNKIEFLRYFYYLCVLFKPRLQFNGKEKDPLYFSGDNPLSSRE